MATGKTHARHFRLIVDSADLSGDTRQIGEFGVSRQIAPIEGWSDGVIHYSLGHAEHILTGYQAVFNKNPTPLGSHTELSDIEEYRVMLAMGIRAAPVVGDPCFMGTFDQINYLVDGTDAVLVNVDFIKSVTDSGYEAAFGNVLAAGASLSATTNGTSVDNGASSADGAIAFLLITASDGGTWSLKVQDSPDDGAWSDLTTFGSDGSATGAERDIIAGTVDRYTRFQATRTSGTLSAWVGIVRQ